MKTIIILAFVSLVLVSCMNEAAENRVATTGTVRYVDLEGGFYGIEGDDNARYLPDELSAEFRRDSLRVFFEGIVTDRPTIQMWGRTITLTRIERLQ